MSEKIQKVLAHAGLGSRREIETWLEAGRISINGRLAQLGDRMVYHDKITVDGRDIKLAKSKNQHSRVLVYHKPEGEMCTRHDPDGRATIFDNLPLIRNSRWICVGRLDYNTAGLLLITNDGMLANQLMHPSSEIEREYAVRVLGEVPDAALEKLKRGVRLEEGMAHFDEIISSGGSGANHWYHVTVREGRNRLVRRLWEALGFTVSRLIRIRYGSVYLPTHLRKGHHMELTHDEVASLFEFVNQVSGK